MKQASLLIGLVLLAVPASAQTQTRQPKTLVFLTPAQIDPSKLLAPPPKDGSDVQQKEMSEVKRLIKTRTPERYKQAAWDAEHEDATPFAAVIGPGFDLQKLPATARLLTGVLNDQSIAASTAKDYFKRKFPVTAETPASYRDWTCDKDDRKPETRPLRSYPSGHGTLAYSVGVVLSSLVPEKSQEILARAADYGYSREVCGDHYHSDVDASRVLGTAVGVMLLESAAARPQIEAAREELRAAHLTAR
jgi:acid phosphatase (class A)